MRSNPFLGPALALAASLLFLPTARAQVEGCPEDNCVESQTSLVFNQQTNMMDAFTSATTDYTTSYWYDLCVNLAVFRLNGPNLVNATVVLPSPSPWPCAPGAAEIDMSGSVPTTPGRQYVAWGAAQLHVYFEYDIFVPFPACDPYCEGYWYDALGYSRLIPTQPSSADWPSIVYSYIYVPLPVPIIYEEIAMSGSAATAWSPPVIYSVSPNQWPAGTTTTFTISGDGFGYGPDLTISGNGITAYTNPCAASPSASCNTQIVATVTIDGNTPGGSAETITVTANGLNPSGFLPVPIQGQSGKATAQANTQAAAPVLRILFNGTNIANNGNPSCPGDPACVVVGQQIALTATITQGGNQIVPDSQQWSQPPGNVIANFVASDQNGAKVPLPNPNGTPSDCQSSLAQNCLKFYWVDQGNGRTVTYTSTIGGNPGPTATMTFNITGPTNVKVDAPTGVVGIQASPLAISFGVDQNTGIDFKVSATLPQGNQGAYSWVQLVLASTQNYVTSKLGVRYCINSVFASDPSPALDTKYPTDTGPEANDSPSVTIASQHYCQWQYR
jgi:hypothetical protein